MKNCIKIVILKLDKRHEIMVVDKEKYNQMLPKLEKPLYEKTNTDRTYFTSSHKNEN